MESEYIQRVFYWNMKRTFIIAFLILLNFHTFSQCVGLEEEFKNYLTENIARLDPLEGIWSSSSTIKIYNQFNQLVDSKYTPQAAQYVIIKDGDKFNFCSITSNHDMSIIVFNKTASKGVYLYKKTFIGSNVVARANAVLSSGTFLEYSYEVPEEELRFTLQDKYEKGFSSFVDIKMIKLFPSMDNFKKITPSSGTGFGITSNGLIITNAHVINGATKISIRGINGDFSKLYSAKILAEDKKNDLAIIQITDPSFVTLGIIPFTIASQTLDVGRSVYTLGYPLKAMMGEEIKMTDGIISSKTGFQGDVTSYQISVPLQPGNSGGPLFDTNGNLVGIVNAKLTIGENVSYAIKTSYLTNLLDLLTTPTKLQTINLLKGKQITEQVKVLKTLIYIVEVN